MKTISNFLRMGMVAFALLIAGAGTSMPVFAFDDQDAALKALKNGDILPYAKIKKKVEKQLGGQVVGSNLRRTNKGWQYDLRVRRDNGKVMVAIVDAATGAILLTR
ncbi:PepSY domain-containing protein [Kordiimonas pumila]|uniref:PepSY domain-containing protein n=1 Tax=Kordiimonas pumila TaxID=2161677 RepID=A0ABV7D9N1_9PROT|nr:PepSY domain-containing protein [Kordiimonas pumila]